MVTVDKTGLMSRAVKMAQAVMMIQAMLGLVGVVLLSGLFFGGTAEPEGAAGSLFLMGAFVLVGTGLIGWLAFQWDSRKRSVWVATVAIESSLALLPAIGLVFDPDSGVADLLDFSLVPVVAVVLLLLPSAKAWFDR